MKKKYIQILTTNKQEPECNKLYYENGKIRKESWYLNDQLHREDGPAYVMRYKDGSIYYEEWVICNEVHREDGPAMIWYNLNGIVDEKRWVLNGKETTEEEVKRYKLIKEMAGVK